MTDTADAVARLVFRRDLGAPGFCLLDLGTGLTPRAFRAGVVELGGALAEWYAAAFGRPLHFFCVGRFDQQSPTRPHRDGGPDGSLLLLGYEPSEVASRLYLVDHSRAAAGLGLRPRDFLDRYNPTFGEGAAVLAAHTTELTDFRPGRFQVLAINNGCLEGDTGMLGVLHHAVVSPRPDRPRVINSVQLGLIDAGLTEAHLAAFVESGAAAAC